MSLDTDAQTHTRTHTQSFALGVHHVKGGTKAASARNTKHLGCDANGETGHTSEVICLYLFSPGNDGIFISAHSPYRDTLRL